MSIKISVMTGKMKNIPTINTNPLDNPFCLKMAETKAVCRHCYSQKMLRGLRKNCAPSWSENGKILSSSIIPVEELPEVNSHWFRFSGHGELINSNHFINLCNIAKKNPRNTFALWTKRTDFVRKNYSHVPSNMILIYSNPQINHVLKTPPKGFHRVFNVTDETSSHPSNCKGKKCWECGLCYDKNSKETCLVERLRISKNGASYNRK